MLLRDACDADADVDLLECARLATGAFYGASVIAGGVLCGANDAEAQALYESGLNLGLSYKLLDDVADVTASASEIGKEPGSDAGKFTAVDRISTCCRAQKLDPRHFQRVRPSYCCASPDREPRRAGNCS